MIPARHDNPLRRAVVDLALLPAADIEAVLSALPDGQRTRIEAMLAGLGPQAAARHEHLSPWLAERVASGKGMTQHAARILAQCAAERAGKPAPAVPARTPSLLDRLFDRRPS